MSLFDREPDEPLLHPRHSPKAPLHAMAPLAERMRPRNCAAQPASS